MATDGEMALEALAHLEAAPDLIILDVMMPKVSGFDVLAKIKKNKTLKEIPVVMLTNLAGKEDAEKALSLGALSYLIKSDYNPKEVVDKMVAFVADT
jgi:CheY-like chemotaxis protein